MVRVLPFAGRQLTAASDQVGAAADGLRVWVRDTRRSRRTRPAELLRHGLVGTLAHRAEDLLGMLRDGRLPVRPDLVDLLQHAVAGTLDAAERLT